MPRTFARLLAAAGLAAAAWCHAGAAEVAPAVERSLARGRPVEVMLVLDDAVERQRRRAALGGELREGAEAYAQFRQTQRALMRALKDDFVAAAAEPDLQELTEYDMLPVMHLRLESRRALENLRRLRHVQRIDPVLAVRPTLTESLAWINQPAVAAAGKTGAGTTVAVLDTGADYTRAAFGSCSSPGGACKVVHAQDFAPEDGARDTGNFHGTNVSGIVLGVAPGARVAALDVFSSDGLAYSNHIIAAINWCIANRATHNIVAINMSLGGGRYYGAVAPGDAWGTAIANAVAAGIVVVAAAGNNGYTDSISLPAAYSNVVSVGALQDTLQSGNQVASFSNSASFLTMFAPGATITAAGISMQGTSQAAPHVAGAVAVLKAEYPSDTVAATIAKLKLGANVTDARNGVAKPSLDLAASTATPPATYRLRVTRSGSGSGSVTSSPAAIDCGGQCVADVANGASVTLTALHGAGAIFNGWTGACAGSGVTCVVSMSQARDVGAAFSARTDEDLLPGGRLPTGWAPSNGAQAGWVATTATRYVGTHALQAGAVGDGQSAAVEVTGNFATGTVSFARRVSSQSGDALQFFIDGQLRGSWSGEVPWGMVAFPIAAGTHTLKWVYAKDGSGSAGSDTAWIDSVWLPLAAASARNAHRDFDGDGRADILWAQAGTGSSSLWFMDGAARRSGSGALPVVTDGAWFVAGAGDLDGDGRADVVWRHGVNGGNALWTLNGTSRASAASLPTVSDLGWVLTAVADFDGDGKADLLWRHRVSGRNALWLMDGAVRRSFADLPAVADLSWQVVAAADFDGDGKADLLWRHARTGANAMWLMNGTTRVAWPSLDTVGDTAWRVVGAGDFNGDGRADIAWRHVGNGNLSLWFMNGATRTGAGAPPAVPDLGWTVAGVLDFDGDGKADLLWRNRANGRNAVWLMNGATRVQAVDILAVTDQRWQPASPQANAQ